MTTTGHESRPGDLNTVQSDETQISVSHTALYIRVCRRFLRRRVSFSTSDDQTASGRRSAPSPPAGTNTVLQPTAAEAVAMATDAASLN